MKPLTARLIFVAMFLLEAAIFTFMPDWRYYANGAFIGGIWVLLGEVDQAK